MVNLARSASRRFDERSPLYLYQHPNYVINGTSYRVCSTHSMHHYSSTMRVSNCIYTSLENDAHFAVSRKVEDAKNEALYSTLLMPILRCHWKPSHAPQPSPSLSLNSCAEEH